MCADSSVGSKSPMGKVARVIFLMESYGHQEDWSNGPPDLSEPVCQKIVIGLSWMYEQAQEGDNNIEFWFDNGGYYEAKIKVRWAGLIIIALRMVSLSSARMRAWVCGFPWILSQAESTSSS